MKLQKKGHDIIDLDNMDPDIPVPPHLKNLPEEK